MTNLTQAFLAISLFCFCTVTIAADVQVPSRGLSKDSVRENFGPASAESTPVGDPPITRWRYPGMTVYFEYDHVLHTVIDDKDE